MMIIDKMFMMTDMEMMMMVTIMNMNSRVEIEKNNEEIYDKNCTNGGDNDHDDNDDDGNVDDDDTFVHPILWLLLISSNLRRPFMNSAMHLFSWDLIMIIMIVNIIINDNNSSHDSNGLP